MVSSHVQTFLNKPVVNYTPGTVIEPANFVYRLSVSYEDEELTMPDLLNSFANDPKASEVNELIIGMFTNDVSDSSSEIIEKLVELKDTFKSLKALFIGEMTYEECEISWIQQSDITPILKAYPALEHLQIRGTDGLGFSELQHNQLKTLIIESGGLPPDIVQQVNEAQLPELEKLELWLGSDGYGFSSTAGDFAPILSGKVFPKLTQLGLKNSEIQDEITIAIVQSPVMPQLKQLDLSMGTLSDKGAQALLTYEGIRKLEHLNLRRHFLSNEMMQQLSALGISINLDDQEHEAEEDRYAEVTE